MSKRMSLRRCRRKGSDICHAEASALDIDAFFSCRCRYWGSKLWRSALAKRKAKRGWRPGR